MGPACKKKNPKPPPAVRKGGAKKKFLSLTFFKKIRPFSADGVKYHEREGERRSEKNQALIIAPNFFCAISEVLFIWGVCCVESMII